MMDVKENSLLYNLPRESDFIVSDVFVWCCEWIKLLFERCQYMTLCQTLTFQTPRNLTVLIRSDGSFGWPRVGFSLLIRNRRIVRICVDIPQTKGKNLKKSADKNSVRKTKSNFLSSVSI